MSSVVPVDGAQYYGLKAATPKSALNMQTFLHLLTVQLQNQDPTKPMSDTDFFAQIAQLGQVQGMEQLNNQSLVQQAQSLMGKTVTATRSLSDQAAGTNPIVTGVVTKLSIKQGQYYINIQEANGGLVEVQMSALQSVQPTQNVSAALPLVGKTISGIAQITANGKTTPTEVVGKVLGASVDSNGQVTVQVNVNDANGVGKTTTDSNGKTIPYVVPVVLSDVTNIAG